MINHVTHRTPEIILALDVDNREQAEKILQATGNKLEWVKVGLQSYLRDGPDLVKTIADNGKKVFLDLKLHDIPNTMAKAMESLSKLPIGMLTLHAHAGEEAYQMCSNGQRDSSRNSTSCCDSAYLHESVSPQFNWCAIASN